MSMLPTIASRSKDPDTKVGCVIVGPDNEIRSTGYNSFPRGIKDDVPERFVRPLKYKFVEHAERNAIYNAARIGVSLKGCTLYVPWYPCTDCARGVISAGIVKVVIDYNPDNPWFEPERMNRWKEDMDISISMLDEAGISILKWVRE
jgi:dCMP deaminase